VPAFGFLGLAAADITGAARLRALDPVREKPITVRVIQPNAEQNMKWDADLASQWMERLLSRTSAPHIGRGPDVVVWPETALPYSLDGASDILAEIDVAARGRPVMLGAVRREDLRIFNSLVVTAAGGSVAQIYDKHHLTPFGEYMPLGDLFAWFGINGLAASEGAAFSAGSGPELLSVHGAGHVLPLICYEAIFPGNLRTEERPDWIVHVTNDAWFGKIAGPYQHLAQARMRAVEQGLPVVRAANTGISAVIDPKGRIVSALPLGVEGHFDEAIPAALPATLYARTGDWPALASIAVLAAVLLLGSGRKSD
jgi:apolipoprotein N-acyltransferase